MEKWTLNDDDDDDDVAGMQTIDVGQALFMPIGASLSLLDIYLLLIIVVAGMQTIDVGQALFMPIGASLSLLIMFLFFDSLQVIFAICTASKSSHILNIY